MLVISSKQMAAFGRDSEARFIDRVQERLTMWFPEQVAALGESSARAAVVDAVARGRSHQLQSEYDLFLFACLALALGPRFDADPGLPWAHATLSSTILGSPSQRVERVYELALAASSGSAQPWVPPLKRESA